MTKTVATFSNHAEAGFFRSLLENENIECLIQDSGPVPAGVHHVKVSVPVADYQRAKEIADALMAEPRSAPNDAHPSSGFPFLGITGFIAILWTAGRFIFMLFDTGGGSGILLRIGFAAAIAGIEIIRGLFIGAVVAFLCLVFRPIYQKLK